MTARFMGALYSLLQRIILLGNGLVFGAELMLRSAGSHKGKKVFIDIKSGASPKYFASLIMFFLECGYVVKVCPRLRFLASLRTYRKWLNQFGHLSGSLRSPCEILITDLEEKRQRAAKTFHTSYRYFSGHGGIVLPYPMSPPNYTPEITIRLASLRQQNRTIGVYFSGNQDPEVYDSEIIEKKFQKVTRVKMIGFIKASLTDILYPAEGITSGNTFLKYFVLAEWTWKPGQFINQAARTADSDWLRQLSMCNFFLALPGMVMPMCHNAIESMAVGTIPILEYAEQFHPPLEHGVNAIVYSGAADCVEKIRSALAMPDATIARMREAVVAYYEAHLSPASFVSKVENLRPGNFELVMNAEQLSVT